MTTVDCHFLLALAFIVFSTSPHTAALETPPKKRFFDVLLSFMGFALYFTRKYQVRCQLSIPNTPPKSKASFNCVLLYHILVVTSFAYVWCFVLLPLK